MLLAFAREMIYALVAIRWGDHLVNSDGQIGFERLTLVVTFAGLAAGTGADRLRALRGRVWSSPNGADDRSSTGAAA